ncbi:MAG: transketolase [Paracoccaceae bacterium]
MTSHDSLSVEATELRRDILELAHATQSPHVGGALSCVEIMTTLYAGVMRLDPWDSRDILIFSKGHCCMALYASLMRRGLVAKPDIYEYFKDDGIFAGHPQRGAAPGIEVSTGALGHGLSIGVGWAHAFALDDSDRRVFVVMGDGECQEGAVWEAAMFANGLAGHRLTVIVDANRLQYQVRPSDICTAEPLAEKWRAFGWDVQECDGHDTSALLQCLDRDSDAPRVIIAHTTKGMGVRDFEDSPISHGAPITDERFATALADLAGQVA